MLAGCLPFDEDDLAALFRAISAAKYEVPPWLSRDAVGILAAMLSPKPEDRCAEGGAHSAWHVGCPRLVCVRRLLPPSSICSAPALHPLAGPSRPTAEQLWQHPWMRSGLMRRSVAGWHVSLPELQTDIFAPNVEPEAIRSAYQSDTSVRGAAAGRARLGLRLETSAGGN